MGRAAQKFKTQQRGDRVQTTDANFGRGMYFSNMPLGQGFVKELVNYDFKDNGEGLTPRPGLRTFEHSIHTGDVDYSSDMLISDAREYAEMDNESYKQVILGELTDTKLSGTTLYKGTGYVATGKDQDLKIVPLQEPGESLIFQKPSIEEVHGEPITEVPNVGSQVGTFAYGSNYFYFKDNGELWRTNFDDAEKQYEPVHVTPQALNAKEAVLWGFNMLSPAPYSFGNTNPSIAVIQLLGVLAYDPENPVNVLPHPLANQSVLLKAQYAVQVGQTYTIKWEWKEYASPEWNLIQEDEVTFAEDTVLSAPFSSPSDKIIIRVTATSGDTIRELPVALDFTKTPLEGVTKTSTEPYSLHTCTGMAFWQRRLVLYGVKENKNMLFFSDPDNATYFPYPNNIDIFDEPVRHVLSLKDELLVFTASEIYALTLTPDGLGWTKRLIQDKLNINPWDTHLIRSVKHMVFFRSGNYYYMVVPSARNPGDLSVAPISKNMEEFFNKFQVNVANVVETVYDYREDLTLIDYYNFLDFEDVFNVYVYQTTKGVYLNVVLLYSTLLRNWRICTYESQNILVPYRQDITKRGFLAKLFEFDGKPAIQVLGHDSTEMTDYYIPSGLTDLEEALQEHAENTAFRNYQYVDTGYRELDSDFKKRFREAQFKVYNISGTRLNFYTDFFIDGDLRRATFKYNVNHQTDPESPDYGLLTFDRELVDPLLVPGTTVLAEDYTHWLLNEDVEPDPNYNYAWQDTAVWEDTHVWKDYDEALGHSINHWDLDVSQFPELAFWKVRFPVSGKGYGVRLRLISYNDKHYEILNFNWVFRPMYSR